MDVLKKYSIAFKGLGEGTHRFDMKVDDRFFDAFEGSEIRRGNADVRLTLDKRGNGMALDFDIRGEVAVECDRCLEEFMMPVRYEGTLHVRYSDCERESDGEVMWIRPSTPPRSTNTPYEVMFLTVPSRIWPFSSFDMITCFCASSSASISALCETTTLRTPRLPPPRCASEASD